MNDRIARDLDEILEVAADDLRRFAGARLYVTGGTGFVGTWLVRTLVHANRRLSTNIRLDILTRSRDAIAHRAPDLATDVNVTFVEGDIQTAPTRGRYDGIIHAAAPTAHESHTDAVLRTIVDGTHALIRDVIRNNGAIPVLLISSGAVYGPQPATMTHIPESYLGGPDTLAPRALYDEAKRVAETLLSLAQRDGIGLPRVARLFAFVGPGLPIDAHFAIGNFIRDVLADQPIRVRSDGSSLRSYLYPTDMVTWCFAVFARGGDGRAYNVGSNRALSIADLAHAVRHVAKSEQPVVVAATQQPSSRAAYVPDTRRIADELGVRRTIELDEAILRTLESHAPSRYRP